MQRWILWVILGIVGLGILGAGGIYAISEYRQSRPTPIWVPLQLQVDISTTEQSELAVDIDRKLRADGRLEKVVADLNLADRFDVANEGAALAELENRLFVEAGTAATPTGTVPSINVGMRGKRREEELLSTIVTALTKQVWEIVGLDPETGARVR